MIRTITNAFAVPEIRRKIAFTAAMLLLYRLGSYIPSPGVDINTVKDIESNFGGSNILGFLNLFSGGSLSRLSLFALGIMPYITASIILQLLTVVVPALEKLQKEGEIGQQKITQYTRYLTVILAFAQATGYVFLFRSFQNQAGTSVVGQLTASKVLLIVICLTAGTVLVMWFGELITQRGIGNGISLMIFASIASRIPNGIQAWWTNPDQVFVVLMPFVALAVIVAIVFVQEGQRRIPVQYAKRIVGRRMTSGGSTYLPLRVNMAGVIPVIFAASIMAFPPTVGQLLNTGAARDLAAFFNPGGWAYVAGEVFFIVIFTYFYTAVTFNPVDQADNLKKYGGFIPGVRPGRPTAEYLDRILSRLTFPGALYLGAVAALPTILINQTSANFFFGGTSILIVIGVALDTVKQLEAQLMMRNYEGFLK
ncbi:MAG: preprotein translocase subunit SecY [Solirubrobacterales bacterium]|nr:preprotein translocase subunit SecY [Solirubrobacterales bacterium]MDX6653087.1 preprotein translocase subunit SecY [Solirubrobacterales bacterium]